MKRPAMLAAACAAVCLSACSASAPASERPAAGAPNAAVSSLIGYGRTLIVSTRRRMAPYVGANMDCAACHINAGTQARGGSFAGTAASFPQWNQRAHRVIALQDRIAECFLYSMNGRPPAYQSREMEAIAAYITSLSQGVKLGSKPDPAVALASITLPYPNPANGAALYAQKCSACHGAQGAGSAVYPPLWGAHSFNDGAGMHRVRTMAGFIRYNMPQNAPGTLSDRQAFDIAAFVLAHPRPKFVKTRLIAFPPARADYF